MELNEFIDVWHLKKCSFNFFSKLEPRKENQKIIKFYFIKKKSSASLTSLCGKFVLLIKRAST